jgi:hypothetical protein
MWRRAAWQFTNISEKHTTSVVRVENMSSVFLRNLSSNYQTTWRHILEDCIIYLYVSLTTIVQCPMLWRLVNNEFQKMRKEAAGE